MTIALMTPPIVISGGREGKGHTALPFRVDQKTGSRPGKVVGKSSATKKEKVTKENGERIKVDMTRAEVEAILGKGKHEAGAKIGDVSGTVTVWEGTDGAISVIFTNDKVTATAGWKKK
jgi:hypothetical protein